jgi:hypothetical protein
MVLEECPVKRRGRKPKGGKIISKINETPTFSPMVENVILHLKCSLKDISQENEIALDPHIYNPVIPNEIMTYNNNESFTLYDEKIQETPKSYAYQICCKCNNQMTQEKEIENQIEPEEEKLSMKEINARLKKLKIQYYKNITDKKSACFWCTYPYDNSPCYIPKYEMDESICGYGSFCRPECAVAFLMKENIDDSIKFERYHLLNQIYSKVYNFKKNIKPAPNPHYLLDKFFGNLSIQEYRKLLKSEHMLLVIEKPLTRILPELHEDNEEFIMGIYGGIKTTQSQQQNGGVYKVKRQSEKQQGPSKASIIKETFKIQ